MQKPSETTNPSRRRARNTTLQLTYVAVGVALLAVCAWLTVPAVVPFTLQTFGVFFVLCFLGPKRGVAVIAIYLLLGLVGLPVFSGFGAGVGQLLGPTGGFLLGFLVSSLLYWLGATLLRQKSRAPWAQAILCAVGLAACYLLGTIWFFYVYHATASWGTALMLCVVPYLLPDAAKIALAVVLAATLRRALPSMQEK